jgi:periodic tryptophan protein 1
LNICDVRADTNTFLTYQMDKAITQDLESLQWHPKNETSFIVTTESGLVMGFDTRKFTKPLFSVKAHEKACSNCSFSPHIPNLMATVGTDNMCKLWDLNAASGVPSCVAQKDLK